MGNERELRAFVEQRGRLMETMSGRRADIDRWLAQRPASDLSNVTSLELAEFAGLIQLSRDVLMELVNLDDALLDFVLANRSSSQER